MIKFRIYLKRTHYTCYLQENYSLWSFDKISNIYIRTISLWFSAIVYCSNIIYNAVQCTKVKIKHIRYQQEVSKHNN